MPVVARINVAPVKSLGLHHPAAVELTQSGVEDNRRYHLVDEGGRLFNGKRCGRLVQVRAEAANGALSLAFPDGRAVSAEVELGEPLVTRFWDHRDVPGRVVRGPFADALSDYACANLRLVRIDDGAWGADIDPVTLVSAASVERAGVPDARRYRILLELDGCGAFEEDGWEGSLVRAGEALLRVGGPVPRCAVTGQDPSSGGRDADTLRVLHALRGRALMGVYAQVAEPGRVGVGDPVTPAA